MPEPKVLLALFLAAGALWTFTEIQEKFAGGRATTMDTAILLAFRTASDPANPIGPKWAEGFVSDVSALGGFGVLALVAAASVIFFFISGERRDAWMMLAATVGGMAVTFGLKPVFDRPRPALLLHDVYVYSSSFPSGHAVLAAATYLTLGALIARKLHRLFLKTYVMLVAMAATLLVGISRIYLGAHWPSDVLAGWCLGAAWALVCRAAAEYFEKPERNG